MPNEIVVAPFMVHTIISGNCSDTTIALASRCKKNTAATIRGSGGSGTDNGTGNGNGTGTGNDGDREHETPSLVHQRRCIAMAWQ